MLYYTPLLYMHCRFLLSLPLPPPTASSCFSVGNDPRFFDVCALTFKFWIFILSLARPSYPLTLTKIFITLSPNYYTLLSVLHPPPLDRISFWHPCSLFFPSLFLRRLLSLSPPPLSLFFRFLPPLVPTLLPPPGFFFLRENPFCTPRKTSLFRPPSAFLHYLKVETSRFIRNQFSPRLLSGFSPFPGPFFSNTSNGLAAPFSFSSSWLCHSRHFLSLIVGSPSFFLGD